MFPVSPANKGLRELQDEVQVISHELRAKAGSNAAIALAGHLGHLGSTRGKEGIETSSCRQRVS